MTRTWLVPLAAAVLLAAGCGRGEAPVTRSAMDPAPADASEAEHAPDRGRIARADGRLTEYEVPVLYKTLDNGLKVVVSPDTTAPIATVAVYYKVGLRTEPRGLTGFAHLFEHMMFEGSENLPEGQFDKLIQGNGGVLNGQTKPDMTLYYEVVPAHMLEPVLWAEADRMSRLDVDRQSLDNQRDVVKNEYRLKIENQPYARFISVQIAEVAYENWQNGHNFWGDMEDLDAATLEQARQFYETYYAPNNAVVVIVGDVEPDAAFGMVEKHFGGFEARPQPTPPDLTEPKQTEEKRAVRHDRLAPRPALAWAYHIPEKGTPEYYAMGLISLILLEGQDSLLWERLVTERGYSSFVGGGINLQGDMFDYHGPMIWVGYLIHDTDVDPEDIVADMDDVIDRFAEVLVNEETLERALTKFRSGFYDAQGGLGTARADLLAAFALFDDDPARINQLEKEMRKVTPELIRETARRYLRPENRSLLFLEPGAAGEDGA